MVVISRYPAAGLREVNVSLDSDDVTVKAADGTDVLVEWEARREDVEQPTVTMEEHTLNVPREPGCVQDVLLRLPKRRAAR